MNIGDSITIPAGKEKEPAHAGISFIVHAIDGENVALKLPDETIYNGYTKADFIVIPPTPVVPPKKFVEPVVLEAVIDEKQPPKKGPVPFSFTSPEAIHQKQAEPTKGDIAQAELKKKLTLEQLDAQIAKDEHKDKKDYTIDDYVDTANMFVDFWEALVMTVCRAIAKDTSSTAYKFETETREKLIRHGTKISRKKGWVLPVELLGAGTLTAATTDKVFKAFDKRKEYMSKKKTENPDNVELNKGGPNKGREKKRGPGNPRG